jgi:hypothetical protein
MPDLTRFNAENYRKTRRYLQTMPEFNWWRGSQRSPSDPGCVACAVDRSCAAETGEVTAGTSTIKKHLGCSDAEATFLYWPLGVEGLAGNGREDVSVTAAIARLDAVAARYGVTPEPEPVAAPVVNHEAAFLESCRQVSREAVTHA